MSRPLPCLCLLVGMFILFSPAVQLHAAADEIDKSAAQQQLPYAMHTVMKEHPHITVGTRDAAIVGCDNRALQAAVDYLGNLGGGTVEIGPGIFVMRDALHLRSNVTVRGTAGKTILRKAKSVTSALALDGDFGQEEITVSNPAGFEVGYGIAIWDDRAGGFHTTTARIIGRRGSTFAIDHPLMADCMVANHAKAATVFPVISGYNLRGVRIENLVIDGNRENNERLNGCRGAGIFLYRAYGTVIKNCVVRNYNGDGISFQQSNDVTVVDCCSEHNAMLGFHPGSGSQRPTIRNCVARHNGTDGLFLCWRVRHGQFENNILEANGRYGISIGHKDSDNLFRHNRIIGNAAEGVYFRNESRGMAPHRNRLVDNTIENNGAHKPTAGIRIRGQVSGIVIENNTIRDTRRAGKQTQTIGILIEPSVGPVTIKDNAISAATPIQDRRTQ